MPGTSRPRGIGSSRGGVTAAPMSERQQMALLMQMTSTSQGEMSPGTPARSRDRNERGETALHVAAIKGDMESVKKLLEQGNDANTPDFAGWTPLHEACNHSHYNVAQLLIKSGADVNAKAFEDNTPLHDAAIVGNLKLVKLLIEKGADPLAKNRKGKTPCDLASAAVYSYMNQAKEAAMNRTGQQSKKPTSVTSGSTPLSSDTLKKSSSNTTSSTDDPEESTNSANHVSSNNNSSNNNSKDESDVYEFNASKESSVTSGAGVEEKVDSSKSNEKPFDDKNGGDGDNCNNTTSSSGSVSKRPFNEVDANEEGTGSSTTENDEIKRKKRKEGETTNSNKETSNSSGKSNSNARTPIRQEKGSKIPGPASKTMGIGSKPSVSNESKKSPCASPKPAPKSTDSDGEPDDQKTNVTGTNDGTPKVPPLKIVIPQQSSSGDTGDSGNSRNGKNASARNHPALPYVVASSNSNDSNADKESSSSRCNSPVDPLKSDEKLDKNSSERPPRVLRSSHRTGGQSSSSADRSSNNSSPQLQNNSSTPSPAPPTGDEKGSSSQQTGSSNNNSPATQSNTENEKETNSPQPANTNTTSVASTVNSNEIHPRKRKIRASKEQQQASQSTQETKPEEKPSDSEVHPHDQPITNCYQMYINLRKQIDKRLRSLFPVQPKPPQGFKDYLLNRRSYVLQGKTPSEPTITIPSTVPGPMKDLFTIQEKERYKLKMQHIVEKEKLVLAVEQEILRVHGRAARALANQSLPFSVCSILKDQEVYNVITPEQEQKDLNARSRYNGRLFLSWLQDVDDKWEKIKEAMLLRHHNEAESLHAVQRMDWEWKLKELSLCEWKSKPEIDEILVPQVHVSDDFDLLPA
uniref:CSON010164 protein n=1 Tax=Culicoides sonorensis TaxID=179676 RepID=A0A336LPW3_CULSO